MTRQRRVILEELNRLKTHPSADEIYHRVRERIPRISLGTVYRNLELLCESGEIRKLELAGSQRRFDGMTEDHYHLRCTRCGKIEDVEMEPLKHVETQIKKQSGFQVMGHQLEFYGLCPACVQSQT